MVKTIIIYIVTIVMIVHVNIAVESDNISPFKTFKIMHIIKLMDNIIAFSLYHLHDLNSSISWIAGTSFVQLSVGNSCLPFNKAY